MYDAAKDRTRLPPEAVIGRSHLHSADREIGVPGTVQHIANAKMSTAVGTSARSRRTACGVQHITRRGILLSLPAAAGNAARRCVFCIFPSLCV